MEKLCLALLAVIACLSNKLVNGSSCSKMNDEGCPNRNINYFLYSKEKQSGRQIDPNSYNNFEGFDRNSKRPLKVLIHGFDSDGNGSPNKYVRPALLQIPGIDIITIDYGRLVPDPCYMEAISNIKVVAPCVAQFLSGYILNGFVDQKQLHLIGFGLGAHFAGFIANHLKNLNINVGHITALDPAKPMFLLPDIRERLDESDADFVDVIHTDVLLHGFLQPMGHIDFYPNNGAVQPNCGPIDDLQTHRCYHERSEVLYAESINSPHMLWSFRCLDLYGFIVKECQPTNDLEVLGYYVRESARGNYFLGTLGSVPFSKGRDFTNLDRTLYGKTYLGDELIAKLGEMGVKVRNLTTTV